ncbi:MAG: response regulator [Syntrophomonadaceae bacterium]|jgi:pilus assembly protein CpaE
MKKIRVLLADSNDNTRKGIRRLLELDHSIDVVAEAASGKQVIEKIMITSPEVVIMETKLPDISGIEVTKQITINFPKVFVIIISLDDEIQSFRRAMLAGAKEYLTKPLSAPELHATVRQVAELRRQLANKTTAETRQPKTAPPKENKLITIFGTKGGVGKSVICTNLAVALGQKYKGLVGLVDLDVQFGDISIMMDLNPRRTISELIQEGDQVDKTLLEEYVYERNGVDILAAPPKPELAELVTAQQAETILKVFRSVYEYTLIDTPSFIDEITLSALELADTIILIVSLDLPTIKNIKKGIEVLRSLQLLDKARLVLNRSSGIAGIEPRDVESVLEMKISAEIPSDGKLVVASLNQGIPFVKLNPKAAISRSITELMGLVAT